MRRCSLVFVGEQMIDSIGIGDLLDFDVGNGAPDSAGLLVVGEQLIDSTGIGDVLASDGGLLLLAGLECCVALTCAVGRSGGSTEMLVHADIAGGLVRLLSRGLV